MKYAKFKGGYHYFKVDDNFIGISVYLNGSNAAISTFTGGARWFGKMYEAITEKEFNAVKDDAHSKYSMVAVWKQKRPRYCNILNVYRKALETA